MPRKTYRLPADLTTRAAAAARRRGVSEAHFVRAAIEASIARDEQRSDLDLLRAEVIAYVDQRIAAVLADLTALRRAVAHLRRSG